MAKKPTTAIKITEDQVLHFRARRGHLSGPGASDAATAARAILGAQSQQLNPSLLALSMRMKERPTAASLRKRLLEPPHKLVRTWGQRGTLFIFDPADWGLIIAARREWTSNGRRGAMPPAALVDKAWELVKSAPDPVTRRDLHHLLPPKYVRQAEEFVGPGNAARQLAAGRLLWRLAHRGDVCMADKIGAEQSYVARKHWFPKLKWPDPGTPPRDAALVMARRYLSVYGPATARDLAHFFGARVSSANEWLEMMTANDELVLVQCGDRKGLVALAEDIDELSVKPPRGAGGWPLRLLPLWEAMLMAHADKSWTAPVEADRKLVWRKAAFVAAVVLARGRIVATWAHKERRGRLEVTVSPLSGWNKSKHAAGVRREAKAVANHLELDDAEVTLG
jgi:hypothetical protein